MTPQAKAEWRKLKALAKQPPDMRRLFAQNPDRARRWALEGGGVFVDSSKSLADDNTLAALHALAGAAQVGEKLRAQARGRQSQFHRKTPGPAFRPARRIPPRSRPARTQPRRSIRRGRPQRRAFRPRWQALCPNSPHRNRRVPPRTRTAARRSCARRQVRPRSPLCRKRRPRRAFRGRCAESTPPKFWSSSSASHSPPAKPWKTPAPQNPGWKAPSARKAPCVISAAVTANPAAARDFGVPEKRVFKMNDWVGGRYSLWSAASLSAVAAIGEKQFRDFLRGGREMDSHVLESPDEKNIALRMALLGIWHCGFLGAQTHCVVAYQHRLRGFARYLQQLTMESNGKRACKSGGESRADTGEILWGGEGTNDQHSYFQLLAQGTRMIPADFILAQNPGDESHAEAHRGLLAHALGWSRALMAGRSFESAQAGCAGAGGGRARGQAAGGASGMPRQPSVQHSFHPPPGRPRAGRADGALRAQDSGAKLHLGNQRL